MLQFHGAQCRAMRGIGQGSQHWKSLWKAQQCRRSASARWGIAKGSVVVVLAFLAVMPDSIAASGKCSIGAADAGAIVFKGDTTTVVAIPDPEKIVVGVQFEMVLIVCSDNGNTSISGVDATMPRHGHGMNYKPDVTRESAGRYRAEGFLFHMPGQWRLSVGIDENGKPVQLTSDMTVGP